MKTLTAAHRKHISQGLKQYHDMVQSYGIEVAKNISEVDRLPEERRRVYNARRQAGASREEARKR